MALVAPSSTGGTATAAAAAPSVIAPPTGYAESFVDLWLRSSTSDALRTLAPGVDLPKPKTSAQVTVDKVVAVRSQPMGGRTWLVTVAATVTVPPAAAQSGAPGSAQGVAQPSAQSSATPVGVAQSGSVGVRYFAVQVSMTRAPGSGGAPDSFAVTAAPAQVAAPASLSDPDPAVPAYGSQVGDGPLRDTVAGYLSAYLTGVGDSSRYLSPGARIPAPGSAYSKVTLQTLSATGTVPASPVDGTVLEAQAVVQAEDANGLWPLSYPLRLTARAGRWEVSAVAPLPLSPASAVASSPSSSSTGASGMPSPVPSPTNGAR
ncbi:hypothetical protein [Kitasatospora sp. NPDC127060]|uniref:hypothetical protein n=1 Tax=Kitasatospora sp. NPDC127060 TaxID=3347121 RepID=UPI0036485FC4